MKNYFYLFLPNSHIFHFVLLLNLLRTVNFEKNGDSKLFTLSCLPFQIESFLHIIIKNGISYGFITPLF